MYVCLFNMSKNKRDATAPAKGYEYQLCYLMQLIVSKINDESYSFVYEGNEDIDVYKNNIIDTLIQIKYHSTSGNKCINENLDINGGLGKVYKNFVKEYEKLNNISQIIYSITNEHNCKLITSPKNYESYILNKKDIYEILKDKKGFTDNDDILQHFCRIVVFEFIPDKSINCIIEEVSKNIESTYFYTKMNNTLKAQYKTEYLLSLLHKYIRKNIFSSTKKKIQIKNIVDTIKDDILKNYNEDTLISEIILLLNSDAGSPIISFLINRLVTACILDNNLVNEYKLLKLRKIEMVTLHKLQSDIHKKSIFLFNKLLNDSNETLTPSETKKISHSIANILNSKGYTTNINPVLKTYFNKMSLKSTIV